MPKEDLTETLTDILKAVNKATETKGGSIEIRQGNKAVKITNGFGNCDFCKEERELYPCLVDEGEKVMICESCVEELRESNQS